MSLAPKRLWLRILLIGSICVAIALLYPYQSTVCPAWKIQVVDEAGNPLKDAFVRQHWQDYSVESDGHEQDAYTDENGYVSFPERTIRASLLSRGIGAISNTLSEGIHASYGPDAFIAAYGEVVNGKRLEGSATYEEGKPLPEKVETYVNELY
jgi:hypothetical protein